MMGLRLIRDRREQMTAALAPLNYRNGDTENNYREYQAYGTANCGHRPAPALRIGKLRRHGRNSSKDATVTSYACRSCNSETNGSGPALHICRSR
jgi:hypothetical protein